MKIINAFKHGLALVNHHQKIIGIIYLVNLCIGLLFAVPLFFLFQTKVGSLVARDDLLSGLNYAWWSAFNVSASGLENTIRPSLSGGFGPLFDNLELLLSGRFLSFGWSIFAIALAYLFVAAFFNGGAIALFADERKAFSAARFFSAAGANFHHMAALAATTVAVFALIYKVIHPAIFYLADQIVGDSLSQSFAWWINLVAYLIILNIVFFVTLVFDYAKVIVISEKKESSWLCIWLAIKFIFKNFAKTIGLNLLLVFCAVVLVLLGGTILSVIKPAQLFLLLISFIIQQFFILAKIGMRLTFYASETVMFTRYTAARAAVKKRKR